MGDSKRVNGGIPKMVVPRNDQFIMENPFKMNDLGVTPFQERPKWWLIIDLDDGKIETGKP